MERSVLHDLRNELTVAVATLHALIDGKLEPSRENYTTALEALESVDVLLSTMAPARPKRDDEEFFRLVVEAAPNAKVLVDDRGSIALVNAQTENLFGYKREEMLGRSIEMLVPQRFRGGHPALRNDFIANPIARPMGGGRDLFARRKDGGEVPVEIGLSPLQIDGGNFVLAAIVDITERRRVEEFRLLHASAQLHAEQVEELNRELASASRFKSQFVAAMSHELRTPLNAIIGAAELLAGTELSQRSRIYVDTIGESSEALLSLISSVLDFSKIEAGKMELREAPFDVAPVLEGAVDVVAQLAREKGLSLYTFVDPQIPRVLGDGDRLKQVLLNLVGNAVKFTDRGEIFVRAYGLASDAGRASVRFEVSDTGIGIVSELLPQLFEPFVQADSSSSRRFQGSGLGLSISKHLVELMGGQIGVDTSPGSGSLFWFTADFATDAREESRGGLPSGIVGYVVTADDTFASIVTRYAASWGIPLRRAQDAAVLDVIAKADAIWIAIVDEDTIEQPPTAEIACAFRAAAPERVIDVGSSGALRKPIRQSYLFDAIVKAAETGSGKAAAPAPARPSKGPGTNSGADIQVLVAEDNIRLQRLLQLQFDELGVLVSFVSDGREAVDAVRNGDYALVFMDCQMPNMDGLTATKAIRGDELASGRHVPITAMTANAFAEDRDACFAAGMDDYLSKPVRLGDLRTAIERWTKSASAGATNPGQSHVS